MEGIELKVWRVRAGLTQWDLARELGLHPARISEMERERRPIPPELVLRIYEILALRAPPGD